MWHLRCCYFVYAATDGKSRRIYDEDGNETILAVQTVVTLSISGVRNNCLLRRFGMHLIQFLKKRG
jgi:hypothetical protein